MLNIKVNGKDYKVEEGLTLIQVCDQLGIQLPRFCYHERLPAVGSCRMCLVEIAGARKLSPACTTSISEGLEIITESPAIAKARKTMLEMLLVNHPLDCPICDQGGECDLQDQSYAYGLSCSSVNVEKRAVSVKSFSPLIDDHMTRCIHCTRCVRFATEIAGVENLGAIGRGDITEINTYIEHGVYSELSGNLADVCPVGALNHSVSAYKMRPWELKNTESIDVLDSICANTVVQSTSLAVIRIQPRLNESVNGEWLGDKSRYAVDALRVQRLDTPLLKENGVFKGITWDKAFAILQEQLQAANPSEVSVIAGEFNSIESLFAMKKFMQSIGVTSLDCRNNGVNFQAKDRTSYLFNSKIEGIDQADACLIVGSSIRVESPVLNARIRQRYLQGNFPIGVINEHKLDLTYNYNYLGANTGILEDILNGKHEFSKVLNKAKKPMLILGIGALLAENQIDLIDICKQISLKYNLIQSDWNGYNVLQTSVGILNGLYLSFVPERKKTFNDVWHKVEANKTKLLWLMNANNLNFANLTKEVFVVFQGHHGDLGALNANLILPEPLWLEQDGMYLNLEGRIQEAKKAIPTVGHAKDSWKIIRKFSETYGNSLPFNTLEELRTAIKAEFRDFKTGFIDTTFEEETKDQIELKKVNVGTHIENYYMTDIITKNSPKMAECIQFINNKNITKEI